MRISGIAAILIPAIMVLSSCPFTSQAPLSEVSEARIDAVLTGFWQISDTDSGESTPIVIVPFDEHTFAILANGDKKGEIDAYRAFVTEIGAERFLNVRELTSDNDEEPWYFLNYRSVNGRIELRLVDDKLFEKREFTVSSQLREFFSAHLSDPLLYGENGGKVPDMVLESTGKR
ncbi:MAG: hypothetical protein WCT14_18230 [Treponemataceae bacterium]